MTILTLLNKTLKTAINNDLRVGVTINDHFHEITNPETQMIERHPLTQLGNQEEVLVLGKYYSNKSENYEEF